MLTKEQLEKLALHQAHLLMEATATVEFLVGVLDGPEEIVFPVIEMEPA
jgi:hypothetical protein